MATDDINIKVLSAFMQIKKLKLRLKNLINLGELLEMIIEVGHYGKSSNIFSLIRWEQSRNFSNNCSTNYKLP